MEMAVFQIKASEVDMAFVRKTFAEMENIGARVTMRAVNRALDGVKTDASSAIRDVITVKKEGVDKTFKTSRATTANTSAWIASTGKNIPLIHYNAQSTMKGVSVRVRKDRPRKIIPTAFVATMKNVSKSGNESTHEGVYWRKWHRTASDSRKKSQVPTFLMRSMTRKGYVYNERTQCFVPAAALPAAQRFPIKQLFGPRVPDIMSNEPVMKTILSKADDRLHKNLMHEMDYELSKLK